MENSIQLFGNRNPGEPHAIDSREVAEMVGKDHNKLLRDIRVYCDYLGESNLGQSDFFIESTYQNSQNKTQPCYLITRKGCEMVANKMTGKKGVLFTAAYINRFHAMEQKGAGVPQTRAEALRLAADLEEELERQKPLVMFAKSVEASETTILVGDLAKLLKQNGLEIGQNRLFDRLRREGYLCSRKGDQYNAPTQRSMEMGLFEVRERTINNPDGSIRITRTTKVTGKGQIYFTNKFCSKQLQNTI